jgi:hypothetical protein
MKEAVIIICMSGLRPSNEPSGSGAIQTKFKVSSGMLKQNRTTLNLNEDELQTVHLDPVAWPVRPAADNGQRASLHDRFQTKTTDRLHWIFG